MKTKNLLLVDKKPARHPVGSCYTQLFLVMFAHSLQDSIPQYPAYAKCLVRCAFMANFFPNIIDLDSLGCTKESELNHHFIFMP